MGLRFRKSVKLAPGVKLNFNKKSTGITFGGKGVHYTVNSKGRKTTSVGIPGTGLYYTTSSTGSEKENKSKVNNAGSVQEIGADAFNDNEKKNKSGERWYQKNWGIILCIILFFPVGLYLMCKYAKWNKVVKAAILVFFLALLVFSYLGDENTSPTDENQGAAAVVASAEAATESTTKEAATKKPTTTQATTETTTESTTESTTEATTAETTAETTTEEADSNSEAETVWIPNSGKKYHSNEYCSNMKEPSEVTLEEAEALGFTACSRCW